MAFQYQPYDNSGSVGQILQLMQAGARAHADAARATGDANARAAQIKAQNSAQLAGSLGSIIANAGQQIAQPFTPEGRAHQMQIEEQQRTVEEDKALRTLFAQGQPKPEDVYRVVGPKRGADIIKGFSALQEQNIKTDDAKVGKVANLTAGILALPEPMQPDAYKLARTHLLQLGFKPEDIPEQYSKEFVQQAQQSAMTAKERIEASKPVSVAPGSSLVNPQTGQTTYTAPSRPMAVAAGSTLVNPDNPQAGPVFTAPERTPPPSFQSKDVLLDGKPAMVNFDARTGTYALNGQDVSSRVKPIPPKASTVNVGAAANALDQDGIDYAATEYRITGRMPALGMGNGQARAAIVNAAAKQSKDLRQTPAMAIQKQAAFKSDGKALDQMRKLSTSAEAFEQKALGQADIVAELSEKVGRTKFPILNSAILAGKTEIAGDKDATLLLNAINTFSSEYAKIIEGSTGSVAGSSDASRAAASKLLAAKMSKGTVAGALDLMKREMALTRQGYDVTIGHIENRMGGAPRQLEPEPAAAPPASAKPGAGGQIVVTAPDGSKHPFTTQAQADAFKRLAGIQ